MSNKCMDEIKKEDKKAFKSFIIIMIISGIIGGFVGGFLGGMSDNLKQILGENLSNSLVNILQEITPFASLTLSILLIIVFKIIYTDSRKGYELWKKSNEDDTTIDKIEENLSYLMLLTSINSILGFLFFGLGVILTPFHGANGDINIVNIVCFSIGFIISMMSSILIHKKIINLEKEMNPLLKGSIYDMNFSKKWIDSCDESIKLGIFKSAYKAFSSVSTTCVILWIFCVLGSFLWDFGLLPMTMVTIIWLVQTVSYCMESIKCSKSK